MLCVNQDDIYRIVTLKTSGTTNIPKRIYFTKEDQELTVDFFCNGMQNIVNTGENFLILLPSQTPGGVGDLLYRGLKRFGANPHTLNVTYNFENILNYTVENNITGIVANPKHMLAITEYAVKNNIHYKLNSVLMATDYIADSLLTRVQKTFDCKIFQHYGMTEMGFLGGVSCAAEKGYHICEADIYIEIIDPLTGKNLPDNSWGEIVFTTLNRKAMPFIRYRTGDLGRFTATPCKCGTVLRTLDKVSYRLDNANFRITEFDEAIYSINGIFDYNIQIDNEKQCIYINIFTLNNTDNYTNRVINAVKGISQGYNIKIKTNVGFNAEHYKLYKRKLNYVLCSRRD